VTLTYLFSAKVTLPTNVTFFSLYSVNLWDNHLRYRNNFSVQVIENQECMYFHPPFGYWGDPVLSGSTRI